RTGRHAHHVLNSWASAAFEQCPIVKSYNRFRMGGYEERALTSSLGAWRVFCWIARGDGMADQSTTRYARVKAILDAAHAGSPAAYGGAGKFWENIESFKTAQVYGIRMIAPEAESSCCGGGGSASRSANSGLIKGLT